MVKIRFCILSQLLLQVEKLIHVSQVFLKSFFVNTDVVLSDIIPPPYSKLSNGPLPFWLPVFTWSMIAARQMAKIVSGTELIQKMLYARKPSIKKHMCSFFVIITFNSSAIPTAGSIPPTTPMAVFSHAGIRASTA